jgi:hypothetical protein
VLKPRSMVIVLLNELLSTVLLAMKLQLSTSELEKRDLDTHPNLQSAAIGTPSLKARTSTGTSTSTALPPRTSMYW